MKAFQELEVLAISLILIRLKLMALLVTDSMMTSSLVPEISQTSYTNMGTEISTLLLI